MKRQLNEYETQCLLNAVSFSAIRGFGQSRVRADFKTWKEAIDYATTFGSGGIYGDKRTMIYAITDKGMAAHITNY